MTSPLAHTVLLPPEGEARALKLFCHGIMGRGGNWRGFARKWMKGSPGWGAVLVDLPGHCGSRGYPLDAGADPLDRSAAALVDLESVLPAPVQSISGHSYGGKIALLYGALRQAQGRPLDSVWSLDSTPGLRLVGEGGDTVAGPVVRALEGVPTLWQSRQAFVVELQSRGIHPTTGTWLAQNLERREEGLLFALDPGLMARLLEAFAARDIWEVLPELAASTALHFVVAAASVVWGPNARARLAEASLVAGVHAHFIEGADHWLHVSHPQALLDVLLRAD